MAGRTRAQMIDVTRASLIDAARTAFARDGYAATSMDALTAAAGLTRGALYHHFGGKEGLLRAVVSEIDGEIDTELLAISDAEPRAADALRERSRAYITRTSTAEVQQILFHDAPAVLREGVDVASRSCVDSIAKIIESGQATDEDGAVASPRSLAVALHGALSDLSRWASEGENTRGEGRLEEALAASDVLVGALSPRS